MSKNYLDRARADYYRRLVNEETRTPRASAFTFEQPLSVKKATYQLPGHGLLFCVHGKSYFEPCGATTCQRSKKEADQRMRQFLANL